MEDLSRKITELLSNLETMEQIKRLTGLLGQSDFPHKIKIMPQSRRCRRQN